MHKIINLDKKNDKAKQKNDATKRFYHFFESHFNLSGGSDETRTRDLLRDRQAF